MTLIINYIFITILLIIGLLGNLIGLIVFSKLDTKRFSSRNIFISLAVVDTINMCILSVNLFLREKNIFMELLSDLSCKLIKSLFSHAFEATSSWLLVFLSIDRFISIRFQNAIFNKKISFQCIIIFSILILNLVVYTPKAILNEHTTYNISNQSNFACQNKKYNTRIILEVIDFLNSTLIPFLLMLFFSIQLIYVIFKSRLRIIRITNQLARNRLRKDIKFAITSIILNFMFFIFNLPISLANFFSVEVNSDLFHIVIYIFFASFGVNFYILFFFNSLFRKKVCSLLKFKFKV